MDRDAFLKRVSSAILDTQLPASPTAPAELPEMPPADLVTLFRNRAQSVNSVVHGPVSRHSVPRTVVGIAAGHGIETFASWDELPAPGVTGAMTAEGWDRVRPGDGESPASALATADLGVTGAIRGLAESGSVVLSHGLGRGRLVSLLPEIHVALLRVNSLVRTLVHWAHEEPEVVSETANLVIVTGPSRTGDIELQLNLGVHGPKHMHVVLIK